MKKLLYISFFTFYFSLFTFDVISQPSITWQRFYDNGSMGNNEGRDICSSLPGTYFVVGRSYSLPNAAQVIKINDNGDSLWCRFYPTILISPEACLSTENGSCVMVGYGNGRVKLDANGNVIWSRDSSSMEAELFDVIKTSDNNYIACGSALTPINGYIVKFDTSGNVIWHKFFSAGGYMRFYSISESYSSGYVICGLENDGIAFENKAIVINVDGKGNEIWRKNPMPANISKSCNTIRKFRGKYLAVGSSDTINIVKMDLDGSTITHKRLPPPSGVTSGTGIDGRGELYKSGMITYKNFGSGSGIFIYITRLDSNFNSLDTFRIRYISGDCVVYSSLPLPNSDIFFTGLVELNGWGHNNFYVVRADSNLYSPLISVSQISTNIPVKSALIKNYPNPFNPVTNIVFSIYEKENYTIKIINILGQQVSVIASRAFSPGTYELKWNASGLSSGIYFCIMEGSNSKSTLKLNLIK